MNKYVKMNDNDNYLSLGNFCRIVKDISLNKVFASQTDICMILFDDDTLSDSLVNNYCVGYRCISVKYKGVFLEYKNKYKENNLFLVNLVSNLVNLLHGSIDIKYSLKEINSDKLLIELCMKLYNIAKNDRNIDSEFTIELNNYIKCNNYYGCLVQMLFYIILNNKQPIYVEKLAKMILEDILNKTNISINELEEFLTLNFNDGVNYIYELKRLVKEKNSYACFEMGYMEYTGKFAGKPRYNKAYEYLYIAALNNHPRGCMLIGEMLINNKIGSGSEECIEEGLMYLKKASDLGSAAALNKLGLYYLNKDINKAIKYFEESADKNYVYAYNNLGKIYEDKGEYDKAFSYYEKSALKEESWACNKLGEFYRKGIYVEKDMSKAFYYYNLSNDGMINLIEFYSKYNLAKYFYQYGNYEALVEKDIDKATLLYEESSNHGIIDSTLELIYIYIEKYLLNKTKDMLFKINDCNKRINNSNKISNEVKYDLRNYLEKVGILSEKDFDY